MELNKMRSICPCLCTFFYYDFYLTDLEDKVNSIFAPILGFKLSSEAVCYLSCHFLKLMH